MGPHGWKIAGSSALAGVMLAIAVPASVAAPIVLSEVQPTTLAAEPLAAPMVDGDSASNSVSNTDSGSPTGSNSMSASASDANSASPSNSVSISESDDGEED
ncbi:hypothetical protein [Streptomyces flavidovirens]|uniref:hypothetical protein n=1 Tax=Streptomyces flavidovirens TaxID=67298 RepID=UPI0004002C6F|nr:hypothetical protein [Streptomyces flavidovirens]